MLKTKRLRLVPFTACDQENFELLHANPQSMRDYPAPLNSLESKKKLSKYLKAYEIDGISRLKVSDLQGKFLGYTGIMRQWDIPDFPEAPEIGWRFLPQAWGMGYATEAATAVISAAFESLKIERIFAFTAPENFSSQSVIKRLNLARRDELDFTIQKGPDKGWHGLVWEMCKNDWSK